MAMEEITVRVSLTRHRGLILVTSLKALTPGARDTGHSFSIKHLPCKCKDLYSISKNQDPWLEKNKPDIIRQA